MLESLSSPYPAEVETPEVEESVSEEPIATVDPSAIQLGSKRLKLSEEQRRKLAQELCEIIDGYRQAMRRRFADWDRIDDNYNLVVDNETTGEQPGATQFVSELTRAHVNVATAKAADTLFGTDQIFDCQMLDESGMDAGQLKAERQANEEFLTNYSLYDMRMDRWGPMVCHRAAKQGDAVVRVMPAMKSHRYRYKDANGKEQEGGEEELVLEAELIGNRQMVIWPLEGLSIRDGDRVVGHQAFFTPSQLRSFAASLDRVDLQQVDQIINTSQGEATDEAKQGEQRDLEGKGINVAGVNPFKGEAALYDLWLQNYYLPGVGDDGEYISEPGNYRVILWYDGQQTIYEEENPLWCQNHPYFKFGYWSEDNSVWSSGVGHEVKRHHKADAASVNLLFDSLKVVAHWIRKVKSGSMAEGQADTLMMGQTVVTENPEEDFRTEALGSHEGLGTILSVIEHVWLRASHSSSLTPLEMGLGDPMMKSGASPGSIQQLLQSSGGKFRRVDANLREPLGDLGQFILEILQQMAPQEVYYSRMSEENAGILTRAKFRVPRGDLRARYRIRSKAASATSNKELRKQTLLVLYEMTVSHTEALLGLVERVIAPADPVRAQRIAEEHLAFLQNDLYKDIVRAQEMPALLNGVPDVDATPVEQIFQQQMEQMQQQYQQLEQAAMQMQAQLQQLMGGPQGAMAPPQG